MRRFSEREIKELAREMEEPLPVPVFKSVVLLADSDVTKVSDMRLTIHYRDHELRYRFLCTGVNGNERTLALFPFEEPPLDSYEIN